MEKLMIWNVSCLDMRRNAATSARFAASSGAPFILPETSSTKTISRGATGTFSSAFGGWSVMSTVPRPPSASGWTTVAT